MLVGQKVGPFVLDKELGSGAMGTVYRGRYTKNNQAFAIKVMAPGIGSTNANAAARFEREITILRQFNHPNIVRYFGHGKSHVGRWYAMELIEGESLDRIMERRKTGRGGGRMAWEEVVGLGKQLCAALQHAHEQGVVHRDLKPSNLMILKDGTLKLTDFGIAKDLDVTALTSANCTVGTAAYMSPEQCRGDPDLTHKSDLYSLGVVFYELVTGRKPFEAESAMEMFMQHVQGTFTRPSKLALDMPVWLDTLVCQMLEKKPEHRPLDAGTVYAALESIQQKVEDQRSAGVEAAKQRVIDRPQGAPRPDETDRDMARTLLTGKGRKRRRKRERFYQRGWFVGAGVLALLGALGTMLYLIFGPPPPEKLYEQAKRQMASANHDDHQAALGGPIKEYLARYGSVPGEMTEQVKRWDEEAKVEEKEDLLARYLKKKGSALKFDVQDKDEEAALGAVDPEDEGNLAEARRRWKKIQEAHGQGPWGLTAARHLLALDAVDSQEQRWLNAFKSMTVNGREPEMSDLERDNFRAYRAEHLGELYQEEGKPMDADRQLALRLYKDVKERAKKDPDQRLWLLVAAKKVRDLDNAGVPDAEKAEQDRKDMVGRAVAAAQKFALKKPDDSRLICMDVIAVYGEGHADLEPLVEQARKTLKEVNARQGIRVPEARTGS